MTVLVTGVFGFLGSHLAKKLSEQHEVIGVFNTTNNVTKSEKVKYLNNIDLVETSPDVIVMCHAGVSSGSHKAANELLYKTNVEFTEKVCKRFSGTRVIYISSVSVFGADTAVITEHSVSKPQSEYAISKLWGEQVISKDSGNCIVRLSSLYGEGMKENTLIPNYCNQALAGEAIQVWGDGSRAQNYINVTDAVNLIEKIIPYKGEVNFPILGVSSSQFTNAEVAEIIADLTGSPIEYVNSDNSPSFKYNNELTQNVLNWKPVTSLQAGIKEYIEWKKK